jgi:hypothetical protein
MRLKERVNRLQATRKDTWESRRWTPEPLEKTAHWLEEVLSQPVKELTLEEVERDIERLEQETRTSVTSQWLLATLKEDRDKLLAKKRSAVRAVAE